MLKNRHFISYFSTTLIYLSIAGLFFYLEQQTLVSAKKSEEKTIQMCLSDFVPEVIPPSEEPVVEEEPPEEETPVIEPEIIEEPLPEKEPEIKEEVIPEPIVQKITPKPVVKEVKKKPKVKKKTKKKRVKKKRVRKSAYSRKSTSSKAEQNRFLANIRAKIDKHKSYPRIAKKRRMQGSVKVKFTILGSGKVGNISVRGPKVFHSSARRAIKSAFPVNAKRSPISLPAKVNLTLRYKIR